MNREQMDIEQMNTEPLEHFQQIIHMVISRYNNGGLPNIVAGFTIIIFKLCIEESGENTDPSIMNLPNSPDLDNTMINILREITNENIENLREFVLSKNIDEIISIIEIMEMQNRIINNIRNSVFIMYNVVTNPPKYDIEPVVYDKLTEKTNNRKVPLATECCICSEDHFGYDSIVCELKCSHVFHYNCIRGWVEKSGSSQQATCPICRHPVTCNIDPMNLPWHSTNYDPESDQNLVDNDQTDDEMPDLLSISSFDE